MMNSCKDIEPIILSYVSGDILESQKRMLYEHLKECSACSDEMVKLQRLDLNLIDLKEEEATPPSELRDTILGELPAMRSASLHKLVSPITVLSAVTVALA